MRHRVWWVLWVLWMVSFAGPLAATTLVITSDQECRIRVDGDEHGTVAAGGVLKLELAAGEHLLDAACPGDRRWRETVVLGDLQKVVTIPAGEAEPAPATETAAPPAAEASAVGWSGCVLAQDPSGRWIVRAVIHGAACHGAGFRLADVVLAVGGMRGSQLTTESLPGLDPGPVGTSVEWEIESGGKPRKIVLVRSEVPTAGTVSVLQADLKTVSSSAYDSADALRQVLDAVFAVPTAAAASCRGAAMPCWQRAAGICRMGFGCLEGGTCGGFAAPCFGKSRFSCSSSPGCFWQSWSNSCGGAGQTCAGKLSALACNAVQGCVWQPTCTGVAAPCASLSRELCSLQPGCSLP